MKKLNFDFEILLGLLIRLWLIILSIYTMHHTFIHLKNYYCLTGILFLPLILIETYYSIHNNNLKENKYFNSSLFLFTYSVMPSIWILYLTRICHYLAKEKINLNCKIDYDIEKIENMILITLILSQWLLPKNSFKLEDLYSMIINNLSMSLDIHELFYVGFNDEVIEQSSNFSSFLFHFFILCSWSWSLILLCLNTDSKSFKLIGSSQISPDNLLENDYKVSYFTWSDQDYLPIIFENFYWKYMIVVGCIDGPFFIVRMILIFYYKIHDVKTTFFVFKNFIQIILQMIRLFDRLNSRKML
ncbi:unnamed protein product [Brachionus calyciflorus]|uniref:Uncharacterized protein n=1 Tax=Brachionus calyciflorus TaxID=104777 RepID=A0A813Q867_9BILA|nr:unnamed protein product [Brachionus calyciflorus]